MDFAMIEISGEDLFALQVFEGGQDFSTEEGISALWEWADEQAKHSREAKA